MWKFEEETMEYLAGIEILGATEIPENMVIWEVSTNTYTVAWGPLSNIYELIQEIYEKWLSNSGYRRIPEDPKFELYGKEFHEKD